MKSRNCIFGALAATAALLLTVTTGSTRATDASKHDVSILALEPLYPVVRVIWPSNLAVVNLAKGWKITGLVNSTAEYLRTTTTDVAEPFSTKPKDDVNGAGDQTTRSVDFSGLWFSIPTSTTSTHNLTITMGPSTVQTMYNELRDGTGDDSIPVILTNTKRCLGNEAQPEIPSSFVVKDHGNPNCPPVVEWALEAIISITKGFMLVCLELCVGLALAKMWQRKASDFMNATVYLDKAGAPTKRYSGCGRLEIEALQQGLKVHGRGLVNVISDGNCLFRSVSYGIHGNEGRHHSLRACAVRTLCTSDVDNYPHKMEGEETDERDAIDIAFMNDMKHYFAVVALG